MKKIFTLLAVVCTVSAVSAQINDNTEGYTNSRNMSFENKTYGHQNRHFNHRHSNFYKREMEIRIAEINRQYDCQMREVRNNCYLTRYRKEHVLSVLEGRRRNDIAEVYARYRNAGYYSFN